MTMKTSAIRLYGKNDLRLDRFELPEPGADEILAHVISDSICMSSYKAAIQGADHKRVPDNVSENPIIVGHEFCGEIVGVGEKWNEKFSPGDRFTIQPALNYKGSLDAPGYSYRYIGGDATHVIIPNEVMEMDCLLPYKGEAWFHGSLSEPMSCIVGAFRASYHVEQGTYVHEMGIKADGKMAILAGAGPMGLGAIDLALHGDRRPSLLVVTDIDTPRLNRVAELFPPEEARKDGIDLRYVNTAEHPEEITDLDFDDVFVMAPVKPVIEQADRILAKGGCMNFFAGPTNPQFSAEINFYNIHYAFHHIVGTSGGNTEDMRISLDLMEKGRINPAVMITHVGGLDAVVDTTLNLPKIPGGKKLIYTNISMPLTALDDLAELGKNDRLYAELARLVAENKGLWSLAAEKYLLENAEKI
jgi:threonine dehydrogenase-like Zn-dependent dehydrogenase